MKNVRINDIARELGLSRNTVSKVLNGKSVPEKTRKLVLAKAAELNYKQLSSETNKKYNLLLLSGKPLANFSFFVPIIQRLVNACFEKGHQLFQYVCVDNERTRTFLPDYISGLKIDGIICIEMFSISLIRAILGFNIPTVFLDGSINIYMDGVYDTVIQDNYTPIKQEMTRLINAGIKSFGFVGDARHCLSFRERYEAMLITTGKHDITHHSSMDFIYDDDSPVFHNTNLMVREIKRKKQLCSCYICANDSNARFFINALEAAGYKCPKDIKIIGFDNSQDRLSKHPYLTTVTLNAGELVNALLHTLLLRIKNPTRNKLKITIKTSLIESESTKID